MYSEYQFSAQPKKSTSCKNSQRLMSRSKSNQYPEWFRDAKIRNLGALGDHRLFPREGDWYCPGNMYIQDGKMGIAAIRRSPEKKYGTPIKNLATKDIISALEKLSAGILKKTDGFVQKKWAPKYFCQYGKPTTTIFFLWNSKTS